MNLDTGKPDHIEDYILTLNHGYGGWFGWSNPKNKIYANLILHPKIFDCASQSLVDTHITKPTEQECIDGLNAMIAEHEASQYKRNRAKAYPNHNDCIHALLDGGDTLTDLQAQRTTVKDKYPKPD